jgi:hypothetical protein
MSPRWQRLCGVQSDNKEKRGVDRPSNPHAVAETPLFLITCKRQTICRQTSGIRLAPSADFGSKPLFLFPDDPVQIVTGVGSKQTLTNGRAFQKFGNPCKRFQVHANRFFRGKQKEKELGRLSVEGIEIDPFAAASEG